MNRRRFLERLATLIGMPVAPGFARTAPPVSPTAIELQRSPVAGFQYHHGERLWSQLAVGTRLELVREADNRHDGRAVRIDWHGVKLGYVPRIDNAAVAHLLDAGERVEARIVALNESADPWQRVNVSILLQRPAR